jgi:transcriptional regulator with XRE-family HTH domain
MGEYAPGGAGIRVMTPAGARINLGETVRRLRAQRNLSVRTLARRADFSPSFISQVELNQASPSISSLERLAGALGVTLGEFFRHPDEPAPAVTRAPRRRRLMSWWSRARIEALSPMGAGSRFEAVMITIASGGSSGKRPHGHAGEEFAMVFEGGLRLTVGPEIHTLKMGDAVTFDAAIPHLWENPGRRLARLVLVSFRAGPSRVRRTSGGRAAVSWLVKR